MPERCLSELIIPKNIDTFLDLGCGAGRNLLPFDGKLKLWGVDIVSYKRIKWLKDFTNFRYENFSVEKLTLRLEKDKIDLTNVLVFSSGTLMYVSKKYQERFYNACLDNGCHSFIFQEYKPDSKSYPWTNFKLPAEYFKVFNFRGDDLLTYTTLNLKNRTPIMV